MNASRKRLSRLGALLVLSVGGSTVFSTCQTRIKDAFVGGTKDFLASLLSGENVELLLTSWLDETGTEDGS